MTGIGIDKPKRVTIVLEQEHIAQIKRALLHQSLTEGRQLTLSEGIRRAVEHCYPKPKQFELPGVEKVKGRRKPLK